MAGNTEYEFKKLNDLLCTSFNNVKFDVRDITARIEVLRNQISDLSSESLGTVLKEQVEVIKEMHQSISKIGKRLNELETRSSILEQKEVEKQRALDDIKRIAQPEVKKKIESSIYDIPIGSVRITKIDLKQQFVELTGYAIDMSGFKLYNKAKKNIFTFPDGFSIHGPIKILAGKGNNTNTKLYWNLKKPWHDKGDVATLTDKKGRILSRIKSEPSFSFDVIK